MFIGGRGGGGGGEGLIRVDICRGNYSKERLVPDFRSPKVDISEKDDGRLA